MTDEQFRNMMNIMDTLIQTFNHKGILIYHA